MQWIFDAIAIVYNFAKNKHNKISIIILATIDKILSNNQLICVFEYT